MKDKKKIKDNFNLENLIWNCRNVLRGTVGGNEKNRDAVMGLVFLKFLGDKFEKRKKEIINEHGEKKLFIQKESFYRAKNIFFLKEKSQWSYIVSNASANDIAIIIDNAMSDIEDSNPPLRGALLQKFYVNLGARKQQIKKLIDEINKLDEKNFTEKDLIGRVYEYFLQVFAIDSGESKEKGEFYTPISIVELMTSLIEPYDGTVYDPCCGTGGLFVQSIKLVEQHKGNKLKVSIMGQESNPDTWRLAKQNLAIRGIAHNIGKKATSTFLEDQHTNSKVDFIIANPPFNLKNWRDENQLVDDYRWNGYSAPPVANANYAWILHILSKLNVQNGIAAFLLGNGALKTEGEEEFKIRKRLIENDKIEAIIVLPRQMFYSTDSSVTLWILNNNKKQIKTGDKELVDRSKKILFMDLRKMNENVYEKKFIKLDKSQIDYIKSIYNNWQSSKDYKDIPEFCKSVSLDEIKKKNYSLIPSKYIEFVNKNSKINYDKEMQKIQKDFIELVQEEEKSQKSLKEAFKNIGYAID